MRSKIVSVGAPLSRVKAHPECLTPSQVRAAWEQFCKEHPVKAARVLWGMARRGRLV